ncbi:site-specific DNA-methyltransferase [Stenotrophomonas maltophilia group sp. Smal41]|uniref:DNA-methyltransferase n=1 Tax=Stenotrophomonas maltophilia group sp. Smal41 TaxID=3377168 RepID=UPI00300F6D9A
MIHIGDCLIVMRGMAADSVDAIVTDPPYGLSFMGKRWDYDVPSTETWAECLRVLKPGGHLLAFAGTRTQHRMAVRIEDAGFEIRDMIAWVYGSGFPKSHNGPWGGTGLKPALEPITVARKPLAGTVETNWREHGTGALNIDDCGVGAKFSEGGRWPANLIHDGSDEVLSALPVAPGQIADASTNADARKTQNTYRTMRRGRGETRAGSANLGEVGFKMRPGTRRMDAGSAARFFYCAKASKADRDAGLDSFNKTAAGMVSNTSGQHITRRGDGYQATARANNHPTVKPTDLMRYLCRLVTPAGGIVLDPFMGSGSTGKAAVLEGFQFIGIEEDPAYAAIAEARVRSAQPGLPLEGAA